MRGRTGDVGATKRRLLTALARSALPLWLAVTAGAGAADPVPVNAPSVADRLRAGIAAEERRDCDEADRQLRPLIQANAYETSTDIRKSALEIIVSCRAVAEQNERVYPDALAGTQIDGGTEYLWRLRFYLEIQTKRADAAVATVEAMPAAQPSLLSQFEGSLFFRLDGQLKDKGQSALRERLFKVLTSDAWNPVDGSPAKDGFRVPYARLLLARPGGEAEARALMARVTSPYWLRKISVDPQLRALFPGEIDVRAAEEAFLKKHRAEAAEHPEQLRPLTYAAEDLRELGRPDEALRLLQSVAAQVDDPKAFTDRERYLPWWWDDLARTYEALGRYDEAVAAFRHGTDLQEGGGGLNVSQVINLAVLQTRFGHAKDALATLAAFDDPKRKGSPYGEMMLHGVRGCAHAILGEKQAAAADVAYARAHEADAPGGLSDLLLCTGDVDAAAALFIRRLADPEERASVLLDLSDYADPPVKLPPRPIDRTLAAVKARADVKAAAARAGGTRRFNLPLDDI